MTSLLPFALGLAAGLSTYAGGLLAMRFLHRRDLVFGLTAGLVMGLALLDLLPEALQDSAGLHGTNTIVALFVTGFAFYLLLHRLPAAGGLDRITLLLHSLMDGLGIGLAFQVSSSTGWLVAAAVLAHDMADGANMIGMSMAANDPRRARTWLRANALAPLAGVALGQAVRIDHGEFATVLALFAGGFLCIGACELLPHSRAARTGWSGALASVAGLGLMGLVVHLMR